MTLQILRQMIERASPSYSCELTPEQTRLPGITTVTIDGVFFFDRDGQLLTQQEADAIVDKATR